MPQPYLSALNPHTFWSLPDSTRDRPILGVFVGSRAALMVDAGASTAHAGQFRAALAEHTSIPLRYVALTHWHWDHVFGLTGLHLPAFAHRGTRRLVLEMAALDWRDAALDARVAAGQELTFIAEHVKRELTDDQRADLKITAPEITLDDRVEIDLGGLTVCLLHVGGDHSPDCTVIYSPEAQVAFLGDCFYSGFLLGGGTVYTTDRLMPLLDTLERLPVEQYVLGHDPAPLSRAEFLKDARRLRITGAVAVRLGDREAALAHLPQALSEPLNAYSQEDIDSFLTGLTKPDRNSI